MTTIACDGKSMAADGLQSQNGMITGRRIEKLFLGPGGSIFGCAGASEAHHAFKAWIEANEPPERPDLKGEFEALQLRPDGSLWCWEGRLVPYRVEIPQSIGSGAPFAQAAMLCGKSPREALEIANQLDLASGGDIQSLPLPGAPNAK